MPIKINYNICDNSYECSGITVCPTEALYWDDTKKNLLGEIGMLCADNSKCVSCGKCVGDDGCPIGAIFYAKTEDELEKMMERYDGDIKQTERLFVDRYGAAPIDDSLCVGINELQQMISENKGLLLIEEYADSSIQCLLSSIPVETIIHEIQTVTEVSDIQFYCIDIGDIATENDLLPILKIYRRSKLIGKIEGYYSNDQLDEFKTVLHEILR